MMCARVRVHVREFMVRGIGIPTWDRWAKLCANVL